MPNNRTEVRIFFLISVLENIFGLMFDSFTAENHVFVETMLQSKLVIPFYSMNFCQFLHYDYMKYRCYCYQL